MWEVPQTEVSQKNSFAFIANNSLLRIDSSRHFYRVRRKFIDTKSLNNDNIFSFMLRYSSIDLSDTFVKCSAFNLIENEERE